MSSADPRLPDALEDFSFMSCRRALALFCDLNMVQQTIFTVVASMGTSDRAYEEFEALNNYLTERLSSLVEHVTDRRPTDPDEIEARAFVLVRWGLEIDEAPHILARYLVEAAEARMPDFTAVNPSGPIPLPAGPYASASTAPMPTSGTGLLWRILRLRLALLLERIAYRLAGRP